MQENSIVKLVNEERFARQLRLLNDIQVENMAGSSEWEQGADHFFWSDSMFILHGLPVSPDNTISVTEAISLIHQNDRSLYQQKNEELEQHHHTDYYLRIITPDGQVKRIHVHQKKIEQDGLIRYRGNWQDERKEREYQQPVRELNQKLSIQLKVFERAEEVGQVGSWQINLETFETKYSDNVYRIYGLPPKSISPHVDSFRKFIHPEDKAIVLKAQEKSYVELIPLHLEYRIIRQDGEIRYISQVSHLLKNNKGEHILSGSTLDITEQKLLETQLREANDILNLQNELFIHAEQIGQLGIWQVNMNTRKAVYSANLYRIYALKPHSVQPGLQNFIQFIHPDDREAIQTAYTKAFEEHVPPELEFRITRADGKLRTLRQRSRFIKNNADELLIGVVQDITEHEQKDKLLKETNEKLTLQNESFRQAEKLANSGSWTWNIDTNEIAYSDNVYVIYGLKPQSLLPGYENFEKYIHPDDRKRMKKIPEKIRTLREPMTVEYRIIRTDGELRYLRSKNHPITTPDGQTVIIGTTQDVTPEVQLKEQLLEKIRFAQMLSDTVVDRIIVTDTANNIISWNKSCEQFYQHEREEVLGKNFFDVFPQLKVQHIMEWFKKALGGETIHIPVMPSLQIPGYYHELFIVPIKNERDQVMAVLHVLHDITQQQQLQEQLSSRLQFIEKLQESSIDRIMVLNSDLYFQLWNKQCEKYYGLAKDQVIGRNILEVFPKFKTDPLYRHCLKALDGETVHVPADDRAGLAGYQESYFIPLKNEVKEVTGLLWIIHDLTERFIAEQRLRTSEMHLRTAQEVARMGSFEIDLPEEKIKWSEETYNIFDYPLGEEITPEKAGDRIHADDRINVQEIFNDMRKAVYNSFDLHFRIIDSIGKTKHLYSRTQIIRNDEGEPIKILGIVQDITERKRADEQGINAGK